MVYLRLPKSVAEEWARDLLEKRPCGCYRCQDSDFAHWWKFTRFRYWFRCLSGWRQYFVVWWSWWWREKLLDLMEWANPIHLVFGMVSYAEAQDRERRIESVRGENMESRRKVLWLGADSDHPDGIYATAGHHLVHMTNEEAEHW